MVQPLQKEIDSAVTAERNKAFEFKKQNNYQSAEKHYLKAWELLPEPKYDWDSSQILIYRISDFYLEWRKFEQALAWAKQVFDTKPLAGDGTPYITLGRIYFEAGDMDQAFSNFEKAFELAGKRAYDGEDKKYLEFYKKRAAEG